MPRFRRASGSTAIVIGAAALLILHFPSAGVGQNSDLHLEGPVEALVRPSHAAQAISSLMLLRRNWTGDDTPFDACSVSRALGHPDDFPAALRPDLRDLLHTADDPCADENRVVGGHASWFVRVDSLKLRGPEPAVHVSVYKSDRIHREVYYFNPENWGIREVRMTGFIQVLYRWP